MSLMRREFSVDEFGSDPVPIKVGNRLLIFSFIGNLYKMKKVEIAKPSSWVRYKPSMCRGCWAGCCTMPVQVTSEELFHMGFIEAHQVNGPLKRISQKLIKSGIIKSFNSRTRLFRLKQLENGDCVFLDSKRLCKIYENRPSICRGFPFNGARPGFCPSQRKSTVQSAMQKASTVKKFKEI